VYWCGPLFLAVLLRICRTRHNFIASNPNTMLNNGSWRKWKKQENFKN
jgi:hypothetical protein